MRVSVCQGLYQLRCPNSGCPPKRLVFILFAFDRDADLGYELLRIVGNAVINQRDLAGKADDLHFVLVHIVQ